MTSKRILIACEESQVVTIEFRKMGLTAFSCDTQDPSGGHPEWHIKDDVSQILGDSWDMIIAFPPCTYLCNSGARWLYRDKSRWDELAEAIDFFRLFLDCDCPLVAIENSVPHKWARDGIGMYSQIIHPSQFGHLEQKATCLWLKGLPPLVGTCDVKEEMMKLPPSERQRAWHMPPSDNRGKLRSKTYPGIARAMASQWGQVLINGYVKQLKLF